MHEAVNMGEGSDLSQGPLKFGGLEVEQQDGHLICHQRRYLDQNVATIHLPPGTVVSKTLVKKAAGTVA